jgi:two-component system response regulator
MSESTQGKRMSLQLLERPTRDAGVLREPPFEPQQPPHMWSVNVLLVDDDVADTCLILCALQRNPNVSTARATNAPDFALRQLETGHLKPDLILLDIHMPRLDGFEFLEGLRDIPSMARMPVVFLTTSSQPSDIARSRETSASLFVVKPDTYFELQARLNGVVRLASSGRWSC